MIGRPQIWQWVVVLSMIMISCTCRPDARRRSYINNDIRVLFFDFGDDLILAHSSRKDGRRAEHSANRYIAFSVAGVPTRPHCMQFYQFASRGLIHGHAL